MSNNTNTVETLDILSLINQGINSAKVSNNDVLLNLTADHYISAGVNLAKIAQDIENNKHFLKKVADVTLPECGAGRSLAQAADKFPGFHDEDLKNWNLDEAQKPAGELKLSVHEMQPGKDGDFKKIFGSFNRPLQALAIKQNRILQFVDLHKELLHPSDYATFFLVERESDDTLFVVRVRRRAVKLEVYVYEFSYDCVWCGVRLFRVVVAEEN